MEDERLFLSLILIIFFHILRFNRFYKFCNLNCQQEIHDSISKVTKTNRNPFVKHLKPLYQNDRLYEEQSRFSQTNDIQNCRS